MGGSGARCAGPRRGGSGSGGGLYATATGTAAVTLHGAFLAHNNAEGGVGAPGGTNFFFLEGGPGGSSGGGFGGGIYLDQKASLTSDTIQDNVAQALSGGTGSAAAPAAPAERVPVAGSTWPAAPSRSVAAGCNPIWRSVAMGAAPTVPPPAPPVRAVPAGRGVDIEGGTVTISKSQIESNGARGGGGGTAIQRLDDDCRQCRERRCSGRRHVCGRWDHPPDVRRHPE